MRNLGLGGLTQRVVPIFFIASLSAAAAPSMSKEEPLSAKGVIALAEKFVAEQGYDLQPRAVGARSESEIWFVGFRAKVGDQIRGIMISDNGRKLKLVSQTMRPDWILSEPEQAEDVGSDEARNIAEAFVAASGVPGLAKRAGKVEEHRADATDAVSDSWWAWFETSAKKGAGRARSFAIVSVDRKTRLARWARK